MNASRESLESLPAPENPILRDAINVYKEDRFRPSVVKRTWQTIWSEWGKGEDLQVDVPYPSISDLHAADHYGDLVIMVPSGLDKKMLGRMFPQMRNYRINAGLGENTVGNGGLLRVSTKQSNLNQTEGYLQDVAELIGRRPISEEEYIVASQFSKLLNGIYLDEKGFTRIAGMHEGRMGRAQFFPQGNLYMDWTISPETRQPDLGIHFVRPVATH
ncbi:MAG TPA: hypothetical protein VG917_02040 [Patescibacteria group bacterium]|nr:hypothetical protein [Patescibacteria group bacterium]